MAVLWERSLIPWIDPNGDPYSGAKAYFFQPHTTTPLVTYTTGALDIPHDHPIIADGSGQFPPIFLPDQTIYRLRITTADDVTVWDVDGISSPTTSIPEPPESDTPEERLYRTGDIKAAWRVSVPSGFVRMNGRTIGSSSSGATERANPDCENLFIFLWNEDPNLSVSGGRGASAAGDWAAGKTLALPDTRGTSLIGMLGMGATASTIVPADIITGGDGDVLGARVGAAKIGLVEAELAEHDHQVIDPGHRHFYADTVFASGAIFAFGNDAASSANQKQTEVATTGITVAPAGQGTPHNNMQPSVFVPFFIKL